MKVVEMNKKKNLVLFKNKNKKIENIQKEKRFRDVMNDVYNKLPLELQKKVRTYVLDEKDIFKIRRYDFENLLVPHWKVLDEEFVVGEFLMHSIEKFLVKQEMRTIIDLVSLG